MNKAKLKSYAPQARRDFIAAVEARANLLGLSEKNGQLDITPSEKKGDIALIGGQAWPAKVHNQRERLIKRIRKDGYARTLEAVAYTWFNRFAALRYMEIHDYLGHGYRVLSSQEGGLPEILTHATEVAGALPGLNAGQVADMKLAGNQDGELYRLLLVAQCNALSKAMPFLFERIDDESELLLPGNLERTDSVVSKLVAAIPEEDWNEVEVIGWLYQFYISEKKDEVIGKVVKSEDIPAATQLFTPNWIVQYLVQNSVGRLWLMANPSSSLKGQCPYYIEPAEQTPEVQAQLDVLIKTRMDADGGNLNPETITMLDPACGSGHILVEAYEVLKGIYLERGYPARSIPRLILEKNLYGLDIDDRAAQLAGFALLMKARADDRRLLETPVKLNVLSLQESAGMDLDEFADHLKPHGVNRTVLGSMLDTFTHAKTFGSLIQISKVLEGGLAGLEDGIAKAIENGDVFAKAAAQDLVTLVQQAKILAMKFDAVVANPPYMGGKFYTTELKEYIGRAFPNSKADLYGCFMEKFLGTCQSGGFLGMITIPNWMYLLGFEKFRETVLTSATITSFIDNGRGVFGSDFGSCSFTIQNHPSQGFRGTYKRLFERQGSVASPDELSQRFDTAKTYLVTANEFRRIPGSPLAYWVSARIRDTFSDNPALGASADVKRGMTTSDNNKFVRYWPEVSALKSCRTCANQAEASDSGAKWFPYSKGGGYRKWYGYLDQYVNWEFDGRDVINFAKTINKSFTRTIVNIPYFFRPSVGFSYITIGPFSMRWIPQGCIYDSGGPGVFADEKRRKFILACMNSKPAMEMLKLLNPSINLQIADIVRLPIPKIPDSLISGTIEPLAVNAVQIAKEDWDASETSWDFQRLYLAADCWKSTLQESWEAWNIHCRNSVEALVRIEEQNNRIFIGAYGLDGEVDPCVSEDSVVLVRADREKDSQRLTSYAIGCMMGRYSLDEPGLIYAHAGNVGFDTTRYKTFPADADGIIPITDELWFEDDAANRIREFLLAVWPAPTLDENMAWLAESLGTKGNEMPAETIRRYLASSFFKDHLQTYKKRPIYWLFSSGKQGAFQALVYLHRYHEGTLARMRAEYVVPLTGKMQSRIEMLEKDRDAASSTAARNKIAKQIESLNKKHVELLAYDEKLRHYADMRITLDLDDGVKVNYGKFGDLLAEAKAVTGGSGDD